MNDIIEGQESTRNSVSFPNYLCVFTLAKTRANGYKRQLNHM